MSGASQYLTLGVAGTMFGAGVGQVQEILDVQPITLLPQAPDHVLGMIDLRGDAVPVLDLRTMLGLGAGERTPQSRIVVMRQGDEEEAPFGILADQVFEVTGLDAEELEMPDAIAKSWHAPCVRGVGRRGGEFVTILDFDHLLERGTVLS